MSCAACQARVEKAVSGVKGVDSCTVNLLTASMNVEGNASDASVISAVKKAGYGASSVTENTAADALPEDNAVSVLKKRVFTSVIFLVILMYLNMQDKMAMLPSPAFLSNNLLLSGILQFVLVFIILFINRSFFTGGFKSLFRASPNMDTLVALGAGISFVYSSAVLVKMLFSSSAETNLYFESSAMIVTFITVGKLLEAVSKGKTTSALKSLMNLSPKTAFVERDGVVSEIPAANVAKGDIFIVKPGSSVPVDGTVIEGEAAVNESAVTGESVPVDKREGDSVISGTINENGFLRCRAERVGSDTTIAQIIQLVSDSALTKAPVAKIADKVSLWFVPAVMVIACITFAGWLIAGESFSFALARGIAVLVVSCPCALGLATPVAIMVGNGVGAKNGILFKTSESLENAGKIKIAALDKTRTITAGKMKVAEVYSDDENALVQAALNLEKKSEHPVAEAVVSFAEAEGFSAQSVENFVSVGGRGVKASFREAVPAAETSGAAGAEKTLFGGNEAFIRENFASGLDQNPAFMKKLEEVRSTGKTALIFGEKAKDGSEKILGLIAVSDTIKSDSAAAVKELKKLGIHTVMLTGDNSAAAKYIAEQAGIDEVIAEILPAQKAEAVKKLAEKGKVCMIGDGINDAPALVSADTGIAVGAGTDVAVDAADIVLMKNSLLDAAAAIRLSRYTLRNIKENLFWAFFYNVILIPIASGLFYPLTGLKMNPMFAAAAMSMSSFCVVTNALRLNLADIYDNRRFAVKNRKHQKRFSGKGVSEKGVSMEKIIKVEGMMCAHCEAHVKEALEKIKGVEAALPDHKSGEVKLNLSKEVPDKTLAAAVEKAGYKFL